MSVTAYKGRPTIPYKSPPPVTRWSWRRGSGESQQVFIKGSWAHVRAEAEKMKVTYDVLEINPISGGMFQLDAAQTGDVYDETHDTDSVNKSVDKLSSLVMRAQFIALGATTAKYPEFVSRIADKVQAKKTGEQTYSQIETGVRDMVLELFPSLGTPVPLQDKAVELLRDLDQDGPFFLGAEFVYRRTISVAERVFIANNGSFAGVYTNTHRVFSESDLRTTEEIPDDFWLPRSLSTDAPAQWLKLPPKCRMTVGHRREVVKEYLSADSWPSLYFPNAV